jgi:hydroxymethylpyrimidine pyrophosphatase-like HAD family hydrolase
VAAIEALRARGIKVLLVTGRILGELQRVAGDLRFVDCVIAENGAIAYFPDNEHKTVLAPPVSQALTARLAALDIEFQAGECLIDADATSAPAILEAVHALELPVILAFNRSRVMALAQGVSKATGS